MRGKDLLLSISTQQHRITPAYAGKRWGCVTGGSGCWDHPRICGEKPRFFTYLHALKGSPPHMRGKANRLTLPVLLGGITPAYAGKRNWQNSMTKTAKDHPRICGEKRRFLPPAPSGLGSPPHMRGKAWRRGVVPSAAGITPAYAGKRAMMPENRLVVRDHPRVCGEKCTPLRRPMGLTGSPPRMRGKEATAYDIKSTTGITPAYAGKRQYSQPNALPAGDHPRVCGEKRCARSAHWWASGSPPRMRGKACPFRRKG